jgi:sensor domain CHASE-containing protein
MSTTTTLARRRNAVALITGTLTVLIALTVLAGYASQNPALITLIPGSAPMRATTAFAILCCGSAVLLLAAGWRRTAAACAVLCGVVGFVKLGEAIAGVPIPHLDLDQFARAVTPQGGVLMACLLLVAATALLLMSGVVRLRSRLAMVGISGSVLHAVGVVAVLSYIAGVASAFTDGTYSRVAVHTAVAIAAIGAALIRFAWRDSLATDIGTPAWLPLLVGTGTLVSSFCLYAAITADRESDFAQEVAFDTEGLSQYLNAGLENRVQPLIRLARHRATVPELRKEDWDADTQMLLTRGGYQAIEWIDATGRVAWTTPPGAGDATPDGNAAFESRRRSAFEAARKQRGLAITQPVDLATGGKGAIVAIPVFVRDELAGYVAGVFRYGLLFQNLLASNPFPKYAVSIRDGGEMLFAQGTPSRSSSLHTARNLGETSWKLDVSPTEALVLQAQSPEGGVLLVGGTLLAVLFSLLVRLAQTARVHPLLDQSSATAAPVGVPALTDTARLPVISYGRDGAAVTWNEFARLLLDGAPPQITASTDGFRTVTATFLRANGPSGSIEALRPLLDSCALPALIFDAEGNFAAANTAAQRTLGWTAAAWSGRKMGRISTAPPDALEIQNVLLMQGQWAVPSGAPTA